MRRRFSIVYELDSSPPTKELFDAFQAKADELGLKSVRLEDGPTTAVLYGQGTEDKPCDECPFIPTRHCCY